MSCKDRDQELLLLAHGALPPLRRMRLLAHLRSCSPCRARKASLEDVSVALAGAIRPPGSRPWSPPGRLASSGATTALSFWLLMLMVACLLGTLSVLVWRNSALGHARPSAASFGCAPNLPNDHCR
ncbi:MAG TPA: zf-HC2 domain-containing protein [Chthonomonadaceae bacterium]|nr:zf-HC2 domain-containing protein [Chthonomonadaceae bacterium]